MGVSGVVACGGLLFEAAGCGGVGCGGWCRAKPQNSTLKHMQTSEEPCKEMERQAMNLAKACKESKVTEKLFASLLRLW